MAVSRQVASLGGPPGLPMGALAVIPGSALGHPECLRSVALGDGNRSLVLSAVATAEGGQATPVQTGWAPAGLAASAPPAPSLPARARRGPRADGLATPSDNTTEKVGWPSGANRPAVLALANSSPQTPEEHHTVRR